MKIYKNYLKKFVPGYASRKCNSGYPANSARVDYEQASANKLNARLNISTPLPTSLLHHLINLLIASSAIVLLYQLNIPFAYAVLISFFIIFLAIFEISKNRKQRKRLVSLQCIDHTWVLNYMHDSYDKVELQCISQGLGILYLLSFVTKGENKPVKICIWKYQTGPEFLAYCSQLLLIGKMTD